MSPFIKLADPKHYVACKWDMRVDHEARNYWVPFFKKHVNTILKIGVQALMNSGVGSRAAMKQAEDCQIDFYARFDHFAANPAGAGRVTILTLDEWRDEILRRHGFIDPFADQKKKENETALPLLSKVVRELDTHGGDDQILAVIEGVFAGNIFDMGASASSARILDGDLDFFKVRDELKRPWLIDDFDALVRSFNRKRHAKAIFFIDNAGSDFILGALPMIRWLARRGTRVVIAANERPTLNDMAIQDVLAWWPRIVAAEQSFKGLPIDLVSTGTGEPLIDLSAVSDQLNIAAQDADLIILEGMGRAIESNLDASFTCDAVNVGMIKDEMIAKLHKGKLYDVVCKFR